MNRRRTTLAALNAWKKREFSYGDADCCQFAAFVAEKVTGTDYVARFTYDSEAAAQRIIEACGSLGELVRTVLGDPSDDLEDGDPVLLKIPLVGEVVGVKLGNRAVALSPTSMLEIDPRYIVEGWHVCPR